MSCHYEPYCEHYIPTQLNSSARKESKENKESKSALLIINVQNDLLPERFQGSSDGYNDTSNSNFNSKLMIGSINELIDKNTFDMYVYCCDAHDAHDKSLVSNHPRSRPYEVIVQSKDNNNCQKETILWPNHCVVDTNGIDFPDELNVPFKGKLNANTMFKDKNKICVQCDELQGTVKSDQSKKSYIMVPGLTNGKTDVEPFSVFKDSEMKETGLARFLINKGITDVYLSGLSRDANVWWGAGDAASYVDHNNNKLFNVFFILDATIPVNSSSLLPDYDPNGNSLHQKRVRELGQAAVHNDLYKNTVDNNWVRGFLNPYGIKAISWSDAINQTRSNFYKIQQGGRYKKVNKIVNNNIDSDFKHFLLKASKYKTKQYA